MLRSLAVAVAVSVFAFSTAQAATYADPQGRFSVEVPDGFTPEKPTNPEFALTITKVASEKDKGICTIGVKSFPESSQYKQAEIDEAFGKIATREFWEAAFKASGATGIEIESAGDKQHEGRKAYYVVVTMTREEISVKIKQFMHPIPGAIQLINCAAFKDAYANYEPEFEKVFASFRPLSSDLVAQAPATPPSVLTLYTGAQYDGAARVLAQDTANVSLLGFAGLPGSVAVAGFGQWEVCEGANYSGFCQVVAAGAAGKALRVGSVRRYISQTKSVEGIAGVAAAASGVFARTAAERIAR